MERDHRMETEILRAGDDSGNRMVAKYTLPSGLVVYAVGVPQAWETPLGPTWSYVVEGDNLTLVDTGCYGSGRHLEEGLEIIGYQLSAVDRIVVTHGHMDHDGSCFDVVSKSGAELWAHEVYSSLLGINRWEIEMHRRDKVRETQEKEDPEFIESIRSYAKASRGLSVDKVITDGLTQDGLTFFYTPGHSPDELCILFDRVLFTGDHILPQITPHPSVGVSYDRFQQMLPESYRRKNRYYGLQAYMKSLKSVESMGDDISVLPAHRAFHDGKFNLVGLERAGEILEHHRTRCGELIDLVRRGSKDLETITREHFSRLKLDGIAYYLAHTEVMSHLEFLQESGDVALAGGDGQMVSWNGTELFSTAIDQL